MTGGWSCTEKREAAGLRVCRPGSQHGQPECVCLGQRGLAGKGTRWVAWELLNPQREAGDHLHALWCQLHGQGLGKQRAVLQVVPAAGIWEGKAIGRSARQVGGGAALLGFGGWTWFLLPPPPQTRLPLCPEEQNLCRSWRKPCLKKSQAGRGRVCPCSLDPDRGASEPGPETGQKVPEARFLLYRGRAHLGRSPFPPWHVECRRFATVRGVSCRDTESLCCPLV